MSIIELEALKLFPVALNPYGLDINADIRNAYVSGYEHGYEVGKRDGDPYFDIDGC